jgi:hypothetical protein
LVGQSGLPGQRKYVERPHFAAGFKVTARLCAEQTQNRARGTLAMRFCVCSASTSESSQRSCVVSDLPQDGVQGGLYLPRVGCLVARHELVQDRSEQDFLDHVDLGVLGQLSLIAGLLEG